MNQSSDTPPLQRSELDELRQRIASNLDALDRVLGRSTPQVRRHLRLVRSETETDTDVPRLQATAKVLDIVLGRTEAES